MEYDTEIIHPCLVDAGQLRVAYMQLLVVDLIKTAIGTTGGKQPENDQNDFFMEPYP